jgi:carotenoid cleavage dioxygenase
MVGLRNDVLNLALDTTDNPYLLGGYAPVDTEIEASDLEVRGEIPSDLNGLYVRNGPNPRHLPAGRYHWFDGDGMLHALHLREGRAAYRNRWVRTVGFQRESRAGTALYRGMVEPSTGNPQDGARRSHYRSLKDTANTDVVFHNGNLMAMWYLAGDPYRIDPATLATLGTEEWGGRRQGCVSAHAKVDEHTGELLFFDYGPEPPYMWYGVVDAGGVLCHYVPVPLPAARMPHDMAITEHHSILMDLPLFADPEVFAAGRHRLVFDRDLPARFAVIPRYGSPGQVRWFEADPCYVYHSINAWEEGDEIVLDLCRTRQPKPPPQPFTGPLESVLEYLRLDAQWYRYRFDLRSGRTAEGPLDDLNTEFPMINTSRLGRPSRYSYHVSVENSYTTLFDGIVKYDNHTGAATRYAFGPGRWGSEAPFASRPGAVAEDDGYLVSFVYDEGDGHSECVIVDAATMSEVGRVIIPQRIPNGFHGCWVPQETLDEREHSAVDA